MRVKDEIKQVALIEATIKVVNEIGFASSSVSKIAKEAGISPATIYIYHKNKEDLLVSTYIDIKKRFGQTLLEGFDQSQPIRDIFKRIWKNGFEYIANHREEISYKEQFANSPYADHVDSSEIDKYYEPIFEVFQKGVEQKVIKDVDIHLFGVFMYYPMTILTNHRLCAGFDLNDLNIEKAFDMAWDAIKL
jgi:AcrR family transcriptional regulator